MMMTYVVLCEIISRFGPALLLFVLNAAMINDFNVSVRRKKVLKAASTAIAISRSTLFPIALADVLGDGGDSKSIGRSHVGRLGPVRNLHCFAVKRPFKGLGSIFKMLRTTSSTLPLPPLTVEDDPRPLFCCNSTLFLCSLPCCNNIRGSFRKGLQL